MRLLIGACTITIPDLFAMSAAFNTVDHGILLEPLVTSLDVVGYPLLWLWTYYAGHSQSVVFHSVRPDWSKSSILGTLHFLHH